MTPLTSRHMALIDQPRRIQKLPLLKAGKKTQKTKKESSRVMEQIHSNWDKMQKGSWVAATAPQHCNHTNLPNPWLHTFIWTHLYTHAISLKPLCCQTISILRFFPYFGKYKHTFFFKDINKWLLMWVLASVMGLLKTKPTPKYHKTQLSGSHKEQQCPERNSWNKICIGTRCSYLTPSSLFLTREEKQVLSTQY